VASYSYDFGACGELLHIVKDGMDGFLVSPSIMNSGVRFRKLLCVFLLGGLLCPWLSGFVMAEEIPEKSWRIVADQITHLKKPETVIARGNVTLRQVNPGGAMVIAADSITYDIEAGTVAAAGNLVIKADGDEIRAATGSLDLSRRTGTFKDVTLFRAENNLHVNGRIMSKTGARTYRLRNGWITTCRAAPGKMPPWSIWSADTRVDREGYAVLKHASFRIRKYPVFYLPYFIMPANTARQSGFLFPEYSQSKRNGVGLLAPLFINLSAASDFTIYPGWFSGRGRRAGAEFRYVSDYHSKGTVAFNYLDDTTVDFPWDDYKSDGFLRSVHDRYWLRGKADQDFGGGVVGRFDLDLVSDRDYLQEFNDGLIGFEKNNNEFLAVYHRSFQEATIPCRETSLLLSKAWPAVFVGGELRAVHDVRGEAAPATSLQTLPRLFFAGDIPLLSSPLHFSWASEYVYYWRDEGIGAHRLDLHPDLIAPLPLGPYFEGEITAGLRETLYRVEEHSYDSAAADMMRKAPYKWPGDQSLDRSMYDFEIDLATTLARDFLFDKGPVKRLRHTLRPDIRYTFVSAPSSESLPDFDDTDRLGYKNLLSYEINNYFKVTGQGDDGTVYSRYYGYFKVSQVYNIEEARRTPGGAADQRRPLSDVFFELGGNPFTGLNLKFETTLSVYGQGVTYYNLESRYASARGDFLTANYRYKQHPKAEEPFFYTDNAAESIHELNVGLKTRVADRFSFEYYLTHAFATGRVVDSSLHLVYYPSCWSMELVASKAPDDISVAVVFSLAGLGKALEVGLSGF